MKTTFKILIDLVGLAVFVIGVVMLVKESHLFAAALFLCTLTFFKVVERLEADR